jgi:hypothetical protein
MPSTGRTVFLGHGRSPAWRELKDFLRERLHLAVDEFNSVSAAGVPTTSRLEEMLAAAGFAFLIMTAEDEQSDGSFHARLNVVHEAGLFQGRLGFRKAIILLEDTCQEFSNAHGLGQIRFAKGGISAKFEEIRAVLEREGLVGYDPSVPNNDATRAESIIALGMTGFPQSNSENQIDQLQITFGHETKAASGLYKTLQTFSVGIRNPSQTQFLSNCKVYIGIPDEGGVTPKSYLIADTFTLNATEERLVPIVRYDEPATASGHEGSTIQLLIPVVGGYYNVGHGWPWWLPVGAYAFTLRATAKEAGAREVVCNVSVDDAGRLHFGAA